MLYAKKSNRVQPIVESEIQHFLNQGYNIIDTEGKVVFESMPEDIGGLKVAFKKHVEEIAELKAHNHELSAEIAELKVALEQAEKARAPKTTKAKKANKDAEVAESTEDASNE